uniref:PDZ domain-containing protein n=1 Tax=Timema poppense TaxID=170557 RepID=A0A7R9D0D9_TIMPO|nr:unnamed protein product [Timema poppensis]
MEWASFLCENGPFHFEFRRGGLRGAPWGSSREPVVTKEKRWMTLFSRIVVDIPVAVSGPSVYKNTPYRQKRHRTLALMLIAYPRTLVKVMQQSQPYVLFTQTHPRAGLRLVEAPGDEPQVNVVSLRSHDFTGLGFNICGNMRDGIYIKDVLHRGPASESGRITPGDRIDSVRISFRHMVFEDALTILSYASPYEVQLEVESAASSRPSTLIRTKRTSVASIGVGDRICHPFYRSQSIADLAQVK